MYSNGKECRFRLALFHDRAWHNCVVMIGIDICVVMIGLDTCVVMIGLDICVVMIGLDIIVLS